MSGVNQACDYFIDLLSPWAQVRVRRMFGGYGLYRAQVMFGLIFDDALYFKVEFASRAEYEALGAAPFRYQAKGRWVTLSYWQVPADILEDADALAVWAERAYQAALQKKKP